MNKHTLLYYTAMISLGIAFAGMMVIVFFAYKSYKVDIKTEYQDALYIEQQENFYPLIMRPDLMRDRLVSEGLDPSNYTYTDNILPVPYKDDGFKPGDHIGFITGFCKSIDVPGNITYQILAIDNSQTDTQNLSTNGGLGCRAFIDTTPTVSDHLKTNDYRIIITMKYLKRNENGKLLVRIYTYETEFFRITNEK